MLEVAFATRELRTACEDAACAEATFGAPLAAALVARLADLRAASHPLELPFCDAHPAPGDDPAHLIIKLTSDRSLVLAANHAKPPRAADGTLIWERVCRVLILSVR